MGFGRAEVRTLFLILFQLIGASYCLAQDDKFNEIISKSEKVPAVIRIYSQVLSFTWPKGFTIGSRSESNGAFTQVFKVVGDSDDVWKQKILISGMQGASVREKEPIKMVTNLLKLTYKSGCPKTYSVTDVGEMKLQSGQPAFVFMVGCGITLPIENSAKDKMMVMVVVIQGSADTYMLQWIERSSTEEVPPLAWAVWRARLDSLLPIQVN